MTEEQPKTDDVLVEPVPEDTPEATPRPEDVLRGSRTSGMWVFLALLVVLLFMIATFVLQNTESVEVSFLWWSGRAPLGAALLIATALGLLLAVVAGTLRILQLRRRVRRERKSRRKSP